MIFEKKMKQKSLYEVLRVHKTEEHEKKPSAVMYLVFYYIPRLVARGPAGSAIKRIADEAILSDYCWGKAPFGKKKTWIYRMSI